MTTLFQQFSPTVIKQQWFSNVRGDVLSGLVVALALIPEAIAFSIIAGLIHKLVYMPHFVLQ